MVQKISKIFILFSRHTPSMYPISSGTGFRSPYPSTLPISTSSLPTDFYRFSPTGLIQPHPGLSPHTPHLSTHPAIVTPGPKPELPDLNHRLVTTIFIMRYKDIHDLISISIFQKKYLSLSTLFATYSSLCKNCSKLSAK